MSKKQIRKALYQYLEAMLDPVNTSSFLHSELKTSRDFMRLREVQGAMREEMHRKSLSKDRR